MATLACGLLVMHDDVLIWFLKGATPPMVNADVDEGSASARAAPAIKETLIVVGRYRLRRSYGAY
jgi:hypothetical protein